MESYKKLENKVIEYVGKLSRERKTLEDISSELSLADYEKEMLPDVLNSLTDELVLFKINQKYGKPASFNLAIGKIEITKRGFAFLTPEDTKDWKGDIYIPAEQTKNAMTGDRVIAAVTYQYQKTEGSVQRIIAKGDRIVIGVVEPSYSNPDELLVYSDKVLEGKYFKIQGNTNTLNSGDSVVCEILENGENLNESTCRIIEVLGAHDAPGVDITGVLKSYGINTVFPEEVIREAKSMPQSLSDELIERELTNGRRDLRSVLTVTIDSEDTKDVDDAVSLEIKDNGNYLLGVHIADVSYYVTQGSGLDAEAYNRGTSVYPVDRVVPMLPAELSNGICSLNKNVDRLAFSVMMEIDQNGNVIEHDIFESIINVDYSITYKQYYRFFEDPDFEILQRFKDYAGQLTMMKNLADKLREKKRARGALDFNLPETKVQLDSDGKPIAVSAYNTTFANNIIEEFMLLCNETVAERFFWYNIPFMYRVHDEPDQEKMDRLVKIVGNLGYTFKNTTNTHPKSIQKLIDSAKGKPEERIISTISLRSLQKAEYRSKNDGHFGLALKYYTHFTSPIRRYPDLFIHRMMKLSLKGMLTNELENFYTSNVDEFAEHCSITERRAADAERESVNLKCTEYMKNHIGETFPGIISGIASFGIFIELDNTIEGLYRFSEMEDYYEFDANSLIARGELSGRIFRIGDKVNVQVVSANIASRQIEFRIIFNEYKKKKENNKKRR